MKTLLNNSTLFSLQKGNQTKRFLLLGDHKKVNEALLKDQLLNKNVRVQSSVWGTLGWTDNSDFIKQGNIFFSEKGQNENSKGVTLQQIEDLYSINPSLATFHAATRVTERYINLSDLDFNLKDNHIRIDELPELRLTLFLNENEGAIVFKQYSKKNQHHDAEAPIEYLLHHNVEADQSYNTINRLDYTIPVIPSNEVIDDNHRGKLTVSNKKREIDFIIKVLTFTRPGTNADEFFLKATEAFNASEEKVNVNTEEDAFRLGDGKYAFRLYNPTKTTLHKGKTYKGKFVKLNFNKVKEIDFKKKTLLLFHGTAADTNGSFLDLLPRKNSNRSSVLEQLFTEQKYEQVIGFDRPTLSQDVWQNAQRFHQFLQGNTFTHPVDIVTTSQGALLAEALAVQHASLPNANLIIGKVVTFSAANGCAYLSTGHKVGLFLSVMKQIVPSIGAKIFLALAQQSVQWILKRPGLSQMDPNGPFLKDLLNRKQINPDITFAPVVSDWEPLLIKGCCIQIKTHTFTLLDKIIKNELGTDHDWVIGCDNQRITPHGVKTKGPYEMLSIHCRYLESNYSHDKSGKALDTHKLLKDILQDKK